MWWCVCTWRCGGGERGERGDGAGSLGASARGLLAGDLACSCNSTDVTTHPRLPTLATKRQPKDQLTCNSCILCGAPPYAKLGPCPLPGPPTPGMRSSFPAPPGLERSSGAWYRGTVHPPPKLWSMGLSGARYTGSKGRAP